MYLLQVQVANILNIPLIVTEHYSKGEDIFSEQFVYVSHFYLSVNDSCLVHIFKAINILYQEVCLFLDWYIFLNGGRNLQKQIPQLKLTSAY